MKVAVYIAYHDFSKGGVFTYANAILKILIKNEDVKELIIIYSSDQQKYINEYQSLSAKVKPFKIRIKDNKLKELLLNFSISLLSYRQVSEKIPYIVEWLGNKLNPMTRIINSIDCDVVHNPYQFSSFYKINKPLLISLHDIQELYYPEFFTPQERVDRSVRFKMAAEMSDQLVVSFTNVKKDLLKFFRVNDEKVSVCPILGKEWIFQSGCTPLETMKEKYALPEKFILYPAQTWAHKNHLTLIKALSILHQKGIHLDLICTGAKNEFYEEIEKEAKFLGVFDRVRFLGIIPFEDLNALYELTRLVVIPTLFEAGSGPLFEAIYKGVPVICSNVTSLPETIGHSEFIFDPKNPDQLADLILRGISDDDFRKRNIENSLKRKNTIDAEDKGDYLLAAYKKAIQIKKQKNNFQKIK